MANALLTPTMVTREALRILHQRLNFIGQMDRQYDDSFAQTGAKIGDQLKIRLPNEYTVRTGRAIAVQDTNERSVTLTVATQKGVDMGFTSRDLTMDIDDFSKRILQPAMARLAAHIEADAFNMYRDVWQTVDRDGAVFDFDTVLAGREMLNEALAPQDDNRSIVFGSRSSRRVVNELKGLFQDGNAIGRQYRTGRMGTTGGFDFYENTLVPRHLTGTAAKTTGYTVNGANQTGSTVTIQAGSTTFLAGDVVTFAGCNRVHPETKQDTGQLQQFVVTADSGGSATTLAIAPEIITSGARQNVAASPSNGGAVVKVAAGASDYMNCDLAFHQDAFTFATADLVMPSGVDFSAREVYDGISMRIVRQYDINNDNLPCRIDVLYGYRTIRPELAVRLHADGAPSP